MNYKKNYSKTIYKNSGIDWKKSLLFMAIWFIIINALFYFIGFKGVFIIALLIVAYFLGPKVWRKIKFSHREKEMRNREPVSRAKILDME